MPRIENKAKSKTNTETKASRQSKSQCTGSESEEPQSPTAKCEDHKDDVHDHHQVQPPSPDSPHVHRPRNSRASKAERILGLSAEGLDIAVFEAKHHNHPTPTICVDSPPRAPITSRNVASAILSGGDTHPHGSSKRLQLPPVDGSRGLGQSGSSTDLKTVGNGSDIDSDQDRSSVGDDGSTRSSPYLFKKSTEHRGRDRFKKILRPLTRSKSAGATVPAYALFLKHQPQHQPSTVNRSTDNVMRNSADFTESEEEMTDGATCNKSKDKKDLFAFFRRSTEGHAGHSSHNAVLPSSETLHGWMKSFEKLLADKYGLKLFREFLRREFSDENIEFWIECERYKTLTTEKQRTTESKRIFREFVATQAPSEVNLDSKTREDTEANMCHADPRLFEAAQKRIEGLMEKDSYPRFLQSDIFLRLLQQRQTADCSLRVT